MVIACTQPSTMHPQSSLAISRHSRQHARSYLQSLRGCSNKCSLAHNIACTNVRSRIRCDIKSKRNRLPMSFGYVHSHRIGLSSSGTLECFCASVLNVIEEEEHPQSIEEYEDARCRVCEDGVATIYEEEFDAKAETVEGEKEVGHAGMKQKAASRILSTPSSKCLLSTSTTENKMGDSSCCNGWTARRSQEAQCQTSQRLGG